MNPALLRPQPRRPRLHQQVLQRLASGAPLEQPVAQRVTAFGMSQMPAATLQALAALAPHSQVILAIPNPCRYYWGDIMDGRELLRSLRRRQPLPKGKALEDVPLQDMHAHTHPLLAAWGRQSRDFVRQLDVFDDAQTSKQQFALAKIDYFDDSDEGTHTPLLQQVQNRIRDLVPMHEHPQCAIGAQDRSIVFHSAHSAVRELEVLEVGAPMTALMPVFDAGKVAIVMDGSRFLGLITRIDLLNYLRRRVQ